MFSDSYASVVDNNLVSNPVDRRSEAVAIQTIVAAPECVIPSEGNSPLSPVNQSGTRCLTWGAPKTIAFLLVTRPAHRGDEQVRNGGLPHIVKNLLTIG